MGFNSISSGIRGPSSYLVCSSHTLKCKVLLELTRLLIAEGELFAKFIRKTLFLATVFIFEVGSAVCGSAPTIDAEIVGRAICGVGGMGIYMGAVNLLAVTTTNKERPSIST